MELVINGNKTKKNTQYFRDESIGCGSAEKNS